MARRAKEAKQAVEAINNNAAGVNSELILGWQVYWTINAHTLSVSEMTALINSTLGSDFMPRQPRNKVKLRRAMDSISATGSVKKIKEDGRMIYYALVDEVPDKENIDIYLNKEAIAAYDKVEDRLDFRGGSPDAQDAIRAEFAKHLNQYDEFQVRQVAADFINNTGAISMRRDGKIYFTRDYSSVQKLEAYINALKAMETGNDTSEFYQLPILDVPIAKKQMVTIIKEGLETEIDDLAEEVKRMADAKFTRGLTVVNRMEQFKQARKRCEAYADMLRTDADMLIQRVEELRDEVRSSIEGEQAEYPQSVDFPLGAQVSYDGDKTDKFGTHGVVIGYHNSKSGKNYVKVKFSKTSTNSVCAPSNLKVLVSR